MLSYQNFYKTYTWIPVFGSFIWVATLLSMLFTWAATHSHQRYSSQDGSVPYISDIGADILKPLFVTGCSITAVSFFASLVIERWLRHSGRLIPSMRTRERVFAFLSGSFCLLGGIALILLSIFDTKRYTSLHRLFLLLFMVGVVFSAIFTVIEYRWISKDFVYIRELQTVYRAKAIIVSILVVLGIAFGITLFKSPNVGGVLEWVVAIGFTFYLASFYWDLRMSKGVRKGELSIQNLAADGHEAALMRERR